MVEELEFMLEDYAGEAGRARCFLHIVSIVAKTIIKQFDVPKKKGDDPVNILDQELYKLAEGIEEEEAQTMSERVDGEDDDEAVADELVGDLDEDDRERLLAELRPIRLLLVKVRAQPSALRQDSHLPTAPKARIQDHSLHNYHSPCLACNPSTARVTRPDHAARRHNEVELYI